VNRYLRTPRAAAGSADTPARFDQKLVLFHWMLSLFEVERFEELAAGLKSPDLEGLNAENVTLFHAELVNRTVERAGLRNDDLLHYDNNIVRHTAAISAGRAQPVQWKYFQYLSLLFVEIYLDRWFSDAVALLAVLNDRVTEFNRSAAAGATLDEYEPRDLRKVAFWSATGSGKTLLMHVNILQFRHYLREHGREGELNRIILLTPNEGLSRQHVDEFRLSRTEADLFRKDGGKLFSGGAVEVIEITKLKEEMGDRSVAIDAFEGNNLVLVDEGHRGAGADGVWKDMRGRLAEQGFSFEYSATFGQVVKASTGAGRRKLEQEYARCILFDYSYRYFYRDGYGKDYRILNLADDQDADFRRLYLTACLLAYYQQARLFADHEAEFRPFLLSKPLAIFVGGSVTKTLSDRDASDVVTVLRFFSEFARNAGGTTVADIQRLLDHQDGLVDQKNRPIFGVGSFAYLLQMQRTAPEVFRDLLALVLQAPGGGALHVELLKGSDGELGVRLGDNPWFGVISVGDAPKLSKVCEAAGLLIAEKAFSGSVFASLNDPKSEISVLIGSRKFTEGWNSWRVSTMGLMNIGRSEGSQIIQLFGRGVRLKGYGLSLKRSSMLELDAKPPPLLRLLETLNVFGLRADYMSQFKEYLEEEGLPPGSEEQQFLLPTVQGAPCDGLKLLDVPREVDFKRNGPRPSLEPSPSLAPVVLNWYPRIQSAVSKGASRVEEPATLETGKLTALHTAYFDYDALWFELQRFKAERGWHNLNLTREALVVLMSRQDWYILHVPPAELCFTDFSRVRRWQEIAVALLKKYVERLYTHAKAAFERPFTRYRRLAPDDPMLLQPYTIWYEHEESRLKLRELKDLVDSGSLQEHGWSFGALAALGFSRHLYRPLLHLKGRTLQITPTPLNDGEREFVEDLRGYYEQERAFFAGRELYLLRNLSRGRGIGFFEADNFHPDFIVWLVEERRQFVTFVDPKGIRNLRGLDDAKIALHKTIKVLERQLDDRSVILNSFILSNTPHSAVAHWSADKSDFEDRNVFFQADDKSTYIATMMRRIVGERESL
jgi:hypothetical protein